MGNRFTESFLNGKDEIMRSWEKNPLAVIAISAMAVTALAKFVDAVSSVQGRRAYSRYSQRRDRAPKGRK